MTLSPILLAQLAHTFPRSQHKSRKLPGGGRYIYIPWELYVQRLNLLCPDWEESITHPAICGDYFGINCTLTIAGVKRVGIGSDRVYPEKNEDGKDKIIGDPINNQSRAAFVDACYRFGLGQYLDHQEDCFVWALGHYLNGKPATNNDRLSAFKILSGLSKEQIQAVLADNFGGDRTANSLSDAEIDALLDLLWEESWAQVNESPKEQPAPVTNDVLTRRIKAIIKQSRMSTEAVTKICQELKISPDYQKLSIAEADTLICRLQYEAEQIMQGRARK